MKTAFQRLADRTLKIFVPRAEARIGETADMRPSSSWRLSLLLMALVGGALAACAGEQVPGEGEGRVLGADEGEEGGGRKDGPRDASPYRAGPRTVTLITGDRVTVHAGDRYTIEPGSGRPRGAFRTQTIKGHSFVIPFDALPLLAEGRLDRRLFDVTELLSLGYDDANRPDLPLIVTYGLGGSLRSAANATLSAAGAQPHRELASIGGTSVRARKEGASALWAAIAGPRPTSAALSASGIGKIWLDGARRPVLDQSVSQIGAPTAWSSGYTGLGVTVAVLDTGILDTHPDFAGQIAGTRNFLDESADMTDGYGHGTHVASIVAGSGAGSDGRFRGVAPDAQLLIGKVCDENGSCFESEIIAGMEWAAENGAAIVNLSLSGPDTAEIDPLEQAINTLTALHGTLFVAAAGNDGAPSTVGSPGTADAALSVGAVDRDDQLASFSSRGPRAGDSGVKPEITAPGVDIAAARVPGTIVGENGPVDELYTRASGTSMATPHVAGAAAILAQQHPEWRAAELKAALMGSARPNPQLRLFEQGAGRLDVESAIALQLTASPPSISFGRALWPYDDDQPVARTVTYDNAGTSPVTLDLAVDMRDANGEPAAAGMFVVEPAAVTVPAGGRVEVTVTARPSIPGPPGLFEGTLIASAGGQAQRTLLVLDREAEAYSLDIVFRFRDPAEGEPFFSGAFLHNLETNEFHSLGTHNRLPRGRYYLHGSLIGGDVFGTDPSQRYYEAVFVQPILEFDRDQVITLDAQAAQPTRVTVPHPTAWRMQESYLYNRASEIPNGDVMRDGAVFQRVAAEANYSTLYTQHLGPEVPARSFWTSFGAIWAEPGPSDTPFSWNSFAESPYAYWVGFIPAEGRFPTGINWQIRRRDLASVESTYGEAGQLLGSEAFSLFWRIDSDDTAFGTNFVGVPFQVPARRTDYYATTPQMGWQIVTNDSFAEGQGSSEGLWGRRLVTFQPGSHHREDWSRGVVGPSLTSSYANFRSEGYDPEPGVYRLGDVLEVRAPSLYSDSDDHYGIMSTETRRMRLFADGELVDEIESDEGRFDVWSRPAEYRLELESVRGGAADLSTEVRVTWTFRSRHVSGEQPARLPVMAVRFTPDLDLTNSAPAGRLIAIPFSMSRQPGTRGARLRRLTIDVSYDGGATWSRVPTCRFGDLGFALVTHPNRERQVSLRASAVDQDGNAVEQTILDAYRLRRR